MPPIPRPGGDLLDELDRLKRRVAELERRGSPSLATIKDASGNVLIAGDSVSGTGLARPYLSSPMTPGYVPDWLGTQLATWQTKWVQAVYKQHPKIAVIVYAGSETSGTAGQVRLLVGGTVIGDPVTVTAVGTTIYNAATVTFGPMPWPGTHMTPVPIEVQLQRTAGSGWFRAYPIIWGVES
ncbi:hypothetical protein [Saccharopolyspora sp. 6V]|uniref:hypothetical protein n=1 Tax=Saccharopolyspora sp. 6V TaxID=2877239 RepID=UPI001CD5B508|nr:hypothetical protein [Saccharopolyspora sp. 6V]MCA1191608.1 hypothetical protein [Saccharopolyspora sp. 6V]